MSSPSFIQSVLDYAPGAANFTRPELLLHPCIPQPMWGINPRTIKGRAWWDETRRAAYAENNHCCWACGVHMSQAKYKPGLEAHEAYKIDFARGRMTYVETVALCYMCHAYIHAMRTEMAVRTGEISRLIFEDIVAHGDAVLARAGIDICGNAVLPRRVAPVEKWHLVIDGETYSRGRAEGIEPRQPRTRRGKRK